ncbi:MAG: aminotransferase class V-fold PLP-dependent enzyme [Microbacteriaceae bacterium]
MTTMDDFRAGFVHEPGYFDFARVGPLSQPVLEEVHAQNRRLSTARFGTLNDLPAEDQRARLAISKLTGFDPADILLQPNTGTGLMQAFFGLTGEVLLSAAEFPGLTYGAVRAAEALHVLQPAWLDTDHGRVTPGQIKRQLTARTAAVAVSLVDPRSGYLADIDGIRQVIGDRLLIVDATNGIGIVDAPYSVVDVLLAGGHTWLCAGWGTAFMALSDRALGEIVPVFSGYLGSGTADPWDRVGEPARDAQAYAVSQPDSVAQARLAAAVEGVAAAGVRGLQQDIASRVDHVIETLDEFAVPVVSSRAAGERAGIVVLQLASAAHTLLAAAMHNHGVSATHWSDSIRLSVHTSTGPESIGMLRAALVAYSTAVR